MSDNQNQELQNQEQQTQEQEENKKKKRNRIIEVIIIIILLLLLLTRCCGSCSNLSNSPSSSATTTDILKGKIDWDQPKASRDLQAEIDKAVEQGMFNVFMNTNVVFQDGNSKGNMMIQNIDTNLYPMYVEIYHDDTLLYKSNIIDPGYKIEEAKLDTALSKGTYDCTAYFYVTDSNKEEVQNKIGLNIKITVNN
jgi:hypothetical protein